MLTVDTLCMYSMSSFAEAQCKAGKRKNTTSTESKQRKKKKLDAVTANPLDATWIHPESYELADKLVCLDYRVAQ